MMNKRIFWFIGEQQAGKTNLAMILNSYGADTLLIGETIRQQKDPRTFANESNAYAAPSVEQQVQEMILKKISEFLHHPTSTLLVIDSAPKNTAQHKFVMEHAEISTVFVIREDHVVRFARAKLKYKDDMALFQAREPQEQSWLEMFIKLCNMSSIPLVLLDKRNK